MVVALAPSSGIVAKPNYSFHCFPKKSPETTLHFKAGIKAVCSTIWGRTHFQLHLRFKAAGTAGVEEATGQCGQRWAADIAPGDNALGSRRCLAL